MDKWEDRILCRDESCVGTIGDNGRCRVCGLDSGDQTKLGDGAQSDQDVYSTKQTSPVVENTEDEKDPIEDHSQSDSNDRWEDRILCKDESCTGTIGRDGSCRVCGMTLE